MASNQSLIQSALDDIKLSISDPQINSRTTPSKKIEYLGHAYNEVLNSLNDILDDNNRIFIEVQTLLVQGQRDYLLPAHIGGLFKIQILEPDAGDAADDITLPVQQGFGSLISRASTHKAGPSFIIDGQWLRFDAELDQDYRLLLFFTPSALNYMHQTTVIETAFHTATADQHRFDLNITPVLGSFDGRPNAFMGGTLRVFSGPAISRAMVQTVTITGAPSSGTWTLTDADRSLGTTVTLAINAAASVVEAALETLFGAGQITVSGAAGGPYTLTYADTLVGIDFTALTPADTFDTGEVTVTVPTTGVGYDTFPVQERRILDYRMGSSVLSLGGPIIMLNSAFDEDFTQYSGTYSYEIVPLPDPILMRCAAVLAAKSLVSAGRGSTHRDRLEREYLTIFAQAQSHYSRINRTGPSTPIPSIERLPREGRPLRWLTR